MEQWAGPRLAQMAKNDGGQMEKATFTTSSPREIREIRGLRVRMRKQAVGTGRRCGAPLR